MVVLRLYKTELTNLMSVSLYTLKCFIYFHAVSRHVLLLNIFITTTLLLSTYFQQSTLLNRIWFVLPMTPIQGILRYHRQNINGRLHQMFFNDTVPEGQSDQQGRNKLYTGDKLEQRNRRT